LPSLEEDVLFRGCAPGRAMYCAKCRKSIKKERLEQINRELKERYGKDSLERGLCPVCGMPLLDPEKKARREKDAP